MIAALGPACTKKPGLPPTTAAATAEPTQPSTTAAPPTPEPPTTAATPTPGPCGPPVVSAGDRARVPKLGIDAPLSLRVVGPDGRMEDPGNNEVAIYDFCRWPGLGGRPGEKNVVISGLPRGVFRDFERIASGDEINLLINGQTLQYRVVGVCRVPVAGFEKALRSTPKETLTAILGEMGDTRFVAVAERQAGSGAACPTP